MKAPPNTERSVKAVLNQFVEAYVRRDLPSLRSTFTTDPDVLLYGTGADEKRVGLSEIQMQVERDWSQTESIDVTYGWMSVSSAASVAWVATNATFNVKAGGKNLILPARITFVLENRADQWLIVQAHCSFPAAEQAEGQSFPT